MQARSGVFVCHSCSESGGPIQLVSKVKNVSYDKAIDIVMDRYSVYRDDEEDKEDDLKEIEVPEIKLPAEFRSLAGSNESIGAKPYRKYARKRGLDEELIRRYNIGYCATGPYAGRLVVPVYHLGRLVNFVARALGPAKTKVLTPPGNEQGRYLFNLDNLWGAEEVVVVEGVFDALVAPELAVATFGKHITKYQVLALMHAGVKRVVFAYDNDATEEMKDIARERKSRLDSRFLELPAGEDPSSLGRERFLQLLEPLRED